MAATAGGGSTGAGSGRGCSPDWRSFSSDMVIECGWQRIEFAGEGKGG